MKIVLINALIVIAFGSCSTIKNPIFGRLYKEQAKLNIGYANSARQIRNKFPISFIKELASTDTTFLIERIDEVSKRVEGSIWHSNRKNVVFYNNNSKHIEFAKIDFKQFHDPLKDIAERFDTTSIHRASTYLGASQVFMSQIVGSQIRTYFFSDITPPSFFVEPK